MESKADSARYVLPGHDKEKSCLPGESLGTRGNRVPGKQSRRWRFADCNQHVHMFHHHGSSESNKCHSSAQQWCLAATAVNQRTWERVASAMRQRMKQNRPQRMVKTMRTTPVLLPNSVLRRLGARSACVTATVLGIFEVPKKIEFMQVPWKKTTWRLKWFAGQR
ncbi:hypothetical protein SCA6_015733 [Theobroma cacao]